MDEALERIRALVEPVAPLRTRCSTSILLRDRTGNAEQLKDNEPKRVELYKAVAAVTRAFATSPTI
ncbi:type I restriction-modification system restriction subunit domain protein [Mycobacterium ulcerans str. Harvey]|uniref:Type I restriction-modification system restriction subunit domain protein n=1 Tax=Mycobacterium ulcerans str. Harvey TaxID=1299332 RepID=A0ABN0QUN9_MYCUL|nr:type I restriction-modification system restriction subunit domain protein [Mycobacterium ulcerans str. Harvey]